MPDVPGHELQSAVLVPVPPCPVLTVRMRPVSLKERLLYPLPLVFPVVVVTRLQSLFGIVTVSQLKAAISSFKTSADAARWVRVHCKEMLSSHQADVVDAYYAPRVAA